MEWRKNAGYIITNQITIGESEIVLGVHETHPNMFVTWECSDKNNYYWGIIMIICSLLKKIFASVVSRKLSFTNNSTSRKSTSLRGDKQWVNLMTNV